MGLHDREWYWKARAEKERELEATHSAPSHAVDSVIVKAAAWVIVFAAVFVLVWSIKSKQSEPGFQQLATPVAETGSAPMPPSSFRWSKQ